MGHLADISSMRLAFLVPMACFGLIAVYGNYWPKLESWDAGSISR